VESIGIILFRELKWWVFN